MKDKTHRSIGGLPHNKTVWRMTKIVITTPIWFFLSFPISLMLFLSISFECWFPNQWIQAPMRLVMFVAIIIAGWLSVYIPISIIVRLVMTRYYSKGGIK